MKTILLLTILMLNVSCNQPTGSSSDDSKNYDNISNELEGYTWRKTLSCTSGCEYRSIVFYDGKAPTAYVVEYNRAYPAQVPNITLETSYIMTSIGNMSGVIEAINDPSQSFAFSAAPNGALMHICINGSCDDYERLQNGYL